MNYFISYWYVSGSNSGFENLFLKLNRKIENGEDISLIEERILKINGYSTVKIVNYQSE